MDDDDWKFWFDAVPEYEWHLDAAPERAREEAFRIAVPWAQSISVSGRALARSRTGDPLGARLTVTATAESPYGQATVREAPGIVIWLPVARSMSGHEAIAAVLRKVEGIGVEVSPPSRVGGFRLPNEQRAVEAVETAEAAVLTARENLAAAQGTLTAESRYVKLLYEQGKDVLEPIVREALAELGGQVDRRSCVVTWSLRTR